jgi:hypothetical protein
MVAVALFGKHIQDPITRLLEGTSTGFLTKYVNFEEANLYGIELESNFSLDLIFGETFFAKRTTFGINTIFMKSEEKADKAKFPRITSTDRSLQGASDFIINADIVYELIKNEKVEFKTKSACCDFFTNLLASTKLIGRVLFLKSPRIPPIHKVAITKTPKIDFATYFILAFSTKLCFTFTF